MSVIGQNIKKYRVQKGITQEQLGQLVGVTTQAVSKWERGGTPDAELLPMLSEVLGVSIDALFSREEQNYMLSLSKQLCRMSEQEAYNYAFSICWALEIGLLQNEEIINDFLWNLIDQKNVSADPKELFSKIMKDSGMSTTRLSADFHYFFMMVEPKNGMKKALSDPETLSEVFRVLADKKMLRIIFYMYSRLNTPIAASLISKNTGIEEKEVERCMDVLCKNHLATKNSVATVNGELHSYLFHQESSVIPLLCFADEIAQKDFQDFVGDFARTKPMF